MSERSLLLLAVAGGWIGEALAFLAFNHKRRKTRFLAPFAFASLINAWLLWNVLL